MKSILDRIWTLKPASWHGGISMKRKMFCNPWWACLKCPLCWKIKGEMKHTTVQYLVFLVVVRFDPRVHSWFHSAARSEALRSRYWLWNGPSFSPGSPCRSRKGIWVRNVPQLGRDRCEERDRKRVRKRDHHLQQAQFRAYRRRLPSLPRMITRAGSALRYSRERNLRHGPTRRRRAQSRPRCEGTCNVCMAPRNVFWSPTRSSSPKKPTSMWS